VLEKRSYRGEYVDIFSVGVILFLMVTGSLPYLKEANISDPLYKYIYQKKRDNFWSSWRFINHRDCGSASSDIVIQQKPETRTFLLTSIISSIKSIPG